MKTAEEESTETRLAKIRNKTADELRAEIAQIEIRRKEDLDKIKENAKRERKILAAVLSRKEYIIKKAERKLDDRSKIIVGVGAINFLRTYPEQTPSLRDHLETYYANNPELLDLARRGLKLTVDKAITAKTKVV